MSDFQIPETPNTNHEAMQTVEQAVSWLIARTGMPRPDRGTMSKLGKDCSLAARAMRRPTGVVKVYGKAWPSEKSYTSDVLGEAFRLHPYTRDWLAVAMRTTDTPA